MTPKEKAEKLTMEFIMGTHSYDIYYGVNKEVAKQCALIAVDEVIKQLMDDWGDNQWRSNEYIGYWQEVKQEINNL